MNRATPPQLARLRYLMYALAIIHADFTLIPFYKEIQGKTYVREALRRKCEELFLAGQIPGRIKQALLKNWAFPTAKRILNESGDTSLTHTDHLLENITFEQADILIQGSEAKRDYAARAYELFKKCDEAKANRPRRVHGRRKQHERRPQMNYKY